MPRKADVEALFDGHLIVRLREAWRQGAATLPEGSLAAVALAQASASPQRLQPRTVWQPDLRQALDSVAATRNSLLLSTLDTFATTVEVHAHE